MRKYVNSKRREIHDQPGKMVFLKLQPYKFQNLAKKPNEKLSPRFYRPYQIIKVGVVKWANPPPCENMWEDYFEICNNFPSSTLSIR